MGDLLLGYAPDRNDITYDVLNAVYDERVRQDDLWGIQNHSYDKWISILGEEYGESCLANNDDDIENLREELIQTAAVCVAFVECIDRDYDRN